MNRAYEKLCNYTQQCPVTFGVGSIATVKDAMGMLGAKKLFVVYDQGVKMSGLAEKVTKSLDEQGVDYITYDDITAEPVEDVVDKAYEVAKEAGCDGVLGLGGGSPMDTAKIISVLLKKGGKTSDYFLSKLGPIFHDHVPSLMVPTSSGTGSEVTASAVITDEKTHFKSTIFSYYNLPKFAILDPELIMTAPAHIAAACGVDALIHAMEAYLSNNANPFSDCFAEKAMELIGANLRRFVANRHDEKAACAMMVGSNFAGIAFAWARLGNIHALSHPVSGFFGVAHGVANSVLMPAVMEYNALADIGRYEKIYNYVSVDKEPVKDFKPQMLVDLVTELNKELGIPENLRAVGVTEDKIHAMAVDAMKSGNIPANPRETTLDDVIALYHKAY